RNQLAAQGACAEKGGRLAEVHTLADLQNLRGYLNGAGAGNKFWVGAQLAYRYPSPSCVQDLHATGCASNTQASFRWLSNDGQLASVTGPGRATLDAASAGILQA